MAYTPVLLNFLNTQAKSYLQFFQTFSIHLSLLGPPPKKADDETDTSNYRPISLLSNVNRIFENIMYGTMTDFIEKQSLLYSSQYGFRQAHLSQHAILNMVETIQTNMDKNSFHVAFLLP